MLYEQGNKFYILTKVLTGMKVYYKKHNKDKNEIIEFSNFEEIYLLSRLLFKKEEYWKGNAEIT